MKEGKNKNNVNEKDRKNRTQGRKELQKARKDGRMSEVHMFKEKRQDDDDDEENMMEIKERKRLMRSSEAGMVNKTEMEKSLSSLSDLSISFFSKNDSQTLSLTNHVHVVHARTHTYVAAAFLVGSVSVRECVCSTSLVFCPAVSSSQL